LGAEVYQENPTQENPAFRPLNLPDTRFAHGTMSRAWRAPPWPPRVRAWPLFHHIIASQVLTRGMAGHPRLHGTHRGTGSLVALENELVQLCSLDHNPGQLPPHRPASDSSSLHPEKSPLRGVNFNCRQGPSLLVAIHSTPVSRATSEIKLRRICLRSCLRTTIFQGSGCVVFVFTPCRVAGLQGRRQPTFPASPVGRL
jgi:hypothetical protein